jgi:hypothetical protein
MYEVVLDEAPAITLTIAARSLKYLGRSLTERNTVDNAVQEGAQSTANDEASRIFWKMLSRRNLAMRSISPTLMAGKLAKSSMTIALFKITALGLKRLSCT